MNYDKVFLRSEFANRNLHKQNSYRFCISLFIPLTFVADIYGMNFKFMPELEWHWSYPLI